MKSFFTFVLMVILLVGSVEKAEAQHNLDKNTKYMTFGVFGGANLLNHYAKIPYIPGSPDCGYFDHGDALGYFFGILSGYSIINNRLSVDLRLSYDYRPSKFAKVRKGGIVYNADKDEYTDLYVQHTHSSTLTYLNFELGLKALPFDDLPIYLRFGFDAGNPLFSSDNIYKARIVSPEWALNPSGHKEDVVAEGDMNSAGTAMGASLGFGYEFELNKDFFVAPEISYRYGINSISSDFEWNTNIIRVGVTAFWAIPIGTTKHPIEIEPEIKEPEKEEEIIIVKKEVKKKPVKIEPKKVIEKPKPLIEKFNVDDFSLTETIVTQAYPLLLYVFFDENDARLKSKYKSTIEPTQFAESNLPVNTIDIYYHIFDIVGSRLKKYPDAKITLTGTSDGKEGSSPEERLVLAEQRADNIKQYLISKWEINPNKIKIKTRNIPELPTSDSYQEGFEENRRVEIYSNSPEILAPVIHSKFLEYSSTQEAINANITMNERNILAWELSIVDKQNNEIFKRNRSGKLRGYGRLNNAIKIPVNQILINEAGRAASSNANLQAIYKATNASGKSETKKEPIKISMSKNQFEVGRLNLIVFDFDKSDISSLNKKLIIDFVKSSIHKNSIVKITGGTDRLGEADYNKELSLERAKSVKDFLKSIEPNINIVQVQGTGAEVLKYNNDLPEGRFYCRTVMIEIKTPIK